MNRLPTWKRDLVLEMHSRGATTREIAEAVGCHRDSVTTCVERIRADRRELIAAYDKLSAAVLARYPDAWDLDEWCDLNGPLAWGCPLHPLVNMDDMEKFFDSDGTGCLLCAADDKARKKAGMKRHHERRKAEGRPIVPPRKKPKAKTVGIEHPPKAAPQAEALPELRHIIA